MLSTGHVAGCRGGVGAAVGRSPRHCSQQGVRLTPERGARRSVCRAAVPYERLSEAALGAVTGAVSEASRLCYTEVSMEQPHSRAAGRSRPAVRPLGYGRLWCPHERSVTANFSCVASRCPRFQVGSQHLLLSLALLRDCDASDALATCGAPPEALRRRLEEAAPTATLSPLERLMRPKTGLPPPMSLELTNVVLRAAAACPAAGTVSAEALLLACFAEARCSARTQLNELGVQLAVRTAF